MPSTVCELSAKCSNVHVQYIYTYIYVSMYVCRNIIKVQLKLGLSRNFTIRGNWEFEIFCRNSVQHTRALYLHCIYVFTYINWLFVCGN